jgi:NAD(P)-dependent dehydrogenase (short-subunit alcohol dehydrogenase family)
VDNPLVDPYARPPDPLDFSGRVVLVTGGTRGIGRVIAAGFAAAGADVVVCGRRPPEPDTAEPDAAGEAGAAPPGGPAPDFVACDVRDPDQVDALVAAVTEGRGRLDVVVNNAGGSPTTPSATASPRFSEAVVRLNLLAPMFVSQAANRVMQDQPGGGAIVNVASVSGVRPSPGTAAYGAAKAGLVNLTQTLAVEWGPKVRVNVVVAGLILTDEARPHYGDDEAVARVAATVPLGRFGGPGDVADACLYLASPLAAYVSGAALTVHGGGERPAYLGARDESLA